MPIKSAITLGKYAAYDDGCLTGTEAVVVEMATVVVAAMMETMTSAAGTAMGVVA